MRRIRTALAVTAVAALSLTSLATPAAAATPGAPYTGLGDCPLSTAAMTAPTNLLVACFTSVVASGSMTIGTNTVAFTSTTLQFGAYLPPGAPVVALPDGSSGQVMTTVAPTDGKELVTAPVEVPIPGLINFLPGVTSVYAQVQSAGPITDFVPVAIGKPYPVFTLPIKIKLTGALMGNDCYIGSDAHPIALRPMATNPGTAAVAPDPHGHRAVVLSATGATLTDGALAVPAATGCGLFGLLDPIVNAVFGLPSATGDNTVTFSGTDSALAFDNSITDLTAAIAAASS
jgi:hypothetical protein